MLTKMDQPTIGSFFNDFTQPSFATNEPQRLKVGTAARGDTAIATLTNSLIKPYRRSVGSSASPLASSFKISALFNQNVPHLSLACFNRSVRGQKSRRSIFWPFELERAGFCIKLLNSLPLRFFGFHERTLTLLCSLDFSKTRILRWFNSELSACQLKSDKIQFAQGVHLFLGAENPNANKVCTTYSHFTYANHISSTYRVHACMPMGFLPLPKHPFSEYKYLLTPRVQPCVRQA
jgi:hypothetical protein